MVPQRALLGRLDERGGRTGVSAPHVETKEVGPVDERGVVGGGARHELIDPAPIRQERMDPSALDEHDRHPRVDGPTDLQALQRLVEVPALGQKATDDGMRVGVGRALLDGAHGGARRGRIVANVESNLGERDMGFGQLRCDEDRPLRHSQRLLDDVPLIPREGRGAATWRRRRSTGSTDRPVSA